MDLVYRDIQEKDLPLIKAIYDWYIANSTATFHTEPIQVEQLKEFLFFNHPVYKSFLIYRDDEPLGYCFLTYYKKRQAYDRTAEVTLYLKFDVRHKGIGTVSLKHLEKTAKEVGLKNLLGIITGENTESIALFERLGFEKCAHFRNVGEKFGKILDVVAYQKEI